MGQEMDTASNVRRLIERTIAESGPDNLDVAVWRVVQAVEDKVKGDRLAAAEIREMLLQDIEKEVEAALLQGGFRRDDEGLWHSPKRV